MSSSREVAKQAFDLLQNALEESEARIAQLSEELRHKRPTKNGLEKRLDVLKHRLETSNQNQDRWKTEAGHLEELVENANAKVDKLRAKLAIAESGPDQLTKKEINYWRGKAESFGTQATEYKERIRALRQEITARDEELNEAPAAIPTHAATASTAKDHAETVNAATGQAQDARAAETLKERLKEREAKLLQLTAQRASIETENARLQKELKEEKERAENLSEVANERLDQVNKFREQYEEAEERHEETKWHLGKAKHFERLVQRRKGVTSSLIIAIRGKAKANTALKAGLDSLRRHKASAQATQQKLLAKIERLTAELGAAKEAIGVAKENNRRSQDTTSKQTENTTSRVRVDELEERVNTQAELNQSLEDDLQMSKIVQLDLSNKFAEAQKQLDQQQKANDVVSAPTPADSDNKQSMIDALEGEVAKLREQLAAQANAAGNSAGADQDVPSEISEKLEQSEAKIKQLTELANAWKRKYEFLTTDAPEAYQNQTVAEK